MITTLHPHHPYRFRQLVPGNLFPTTEWIALTLHDQRRRLDRLQMLDPQLVRLADRMKRITQAHQAGDIGFISDSYGLALKNKNGGEGRPAWKESPR